MLDKKKAFQQITLNLVVLLTAIGLFVPILTKIPVAGLDPSWKLAINHALNQGLQFGREFIFTYGPFGSIKTKTFDANNSNLIITGCLYLALCYWTTIMLLARQSNIRWALLYCFSIAFFCYGFDPIHYSIPFLLALVTIKIAYHQPEQLKANRITYYLLPLLFTSLGLLPLVKASLLLLSTTTSLLCAIALIHRRYYILAISVLIIPHISMVLFWVVGGQALLALPEYFINIQPIISGYSWAMMAFEPGSHWTILSYAISSLMLFRMILKDKDKQPMEKWVILLLYAAFLFLSFKEGYVRQDGHELNAATALIIAMFSWPLISRHLSRLTYTFVIATSLLIIGYWSYRQPVQSPITNAQSIYIKPWQDIATLIREPHWSRTHYQQSMHSIKQQSPLPYVAGPTDIYPFDLAYLFANNIQWDPRPVIQSYSVYTDKLAQKNRDHLLGDCAPVNIFFDVEPTDNKVPTSPDGISWPILLNRYKPNGIYSKFAYLKKRPKNEITPTQLVTFKQEKHRLGTNVILPSNNEYIYARIDVNPTLVGRALAFFFRARRLVIQFNLKDGSIRRYNFIPNMARSGYMISPLVQNTAQFVELYHHSKTLDSIKVNSFIIAPEKNQHGIFWKTAYTVTYLTSQPIR